MPTEICRVSFDGSTVSCSPTTFVVEYGKTLVLDLMLESSVKGAQFAADPVVWGGSSPQGSSVSKVTKGEAKITETNSNTGKEDESYCFRVAVTYKGKPHLSEDPSIINKGQG